MASVCLFSCQQQEELQDPSNGVIDFSTSIDQSINNALTRNSSSLTLPLKDVYKRQILAVAAIITYFVAQDDFKMFIYVCGAAIFVKLMEFFIRFTNR